MDFFNRSRRTLITFAVIPLAFLGGRTAGGCFCTDGHFKLYCRGEPCCSVPVVHRGASAACCLAAAALHGQPRCDQHEPKNSSCGVSAECCRHVDLLPVSMTSRVVSQVDLNSPAFDQIGLLPAVMPAGIAQALRCEEIDLRPPRARLSVLQRFLI